MCDSFANFGDLWMINMSENPFGGLCETLERISHGVQTQLSQFASAFEFLGTNNKINSNKPFSQSHVISLSSSSSSQPNNEITIKENKATPVSKEELGRPTWTLLHTLGAQYPDKPTRQQRRDVKELMEILSWIYPCKDCADHFKEILRSNPVQAGSQTEFSQWLCHVHNVVNRSFIWGARLFSWLKSIIWTVRFIIYGLNLNSGTT